jgi:peptidyl-prolyl cis-trans isomerase SurA
MMIFNKTQSLQFLQIILSALLLFTLVSNGAYAKDVGLDKIVAIVNDDVVMFSEIKPIILRMKQAGQTQLSEKAMVKEVLDKVILDKIQIQRAKQVGINIKEVTLDKAMSGIAAQNKLSLSQLKVALNNEGLNYNQFRDNLRNKLTIDALQKSQRRGRQQKISESQVDDLIRAESLNLNKDTQYHLLDILVPAANGLSVAKFNQQLKKAQQLKIKLIAQPSNKIATIIKRFGASQQDLGWKKSQSLSPAYVRALSLLDMGELTDAVRDARGFHILKLIEQRGGNRKITQQARVRHILIPTSNPQAKVKAAQLRNKILAGGNFATLARTNSADTGSAQNGGDLGMMDPASFVPPFAKAVVSLPLNTLSQPIQTRFGWHLIEVLERKASDNTREALKLQAQSILNKKQLGDNTKNWLQGLRDQSYVEYRL